MYILSPLQNVSNVKHYSKDASGNNVKTCASQCRLIYNEKVKFASYPQFFTFGDWRKYGRALTSTLKNIQECITVIFRSVREGTGQIITDQTMTTRLFRSDVDVNNDQE
jgi:hypothetical protein